MPDSKTLCPDCFPTGWPDELVGHDFLSCAHGRWKRTDIIPKEPK